MENNENSAGCENCSNYCPAGVKSYKLMRQLIILAVILGVIALGIVSLIRDRIVNPNRYQVSFTASAKVFAKPDIAQISLAVKTDRQKDAAMAVKNNTDKMNAVVVKVKELGIDEKDIQTSAYNLTPEYDYSVNVGRGALAGYSVYQEVTVKIRDLDKVGKVIESATAAGSNQVGGISFTIDDLTNLKNQARTEAVAKAKEQAKIMAKLTGIKLGKLVNVWENSSNPMPYQDAYYGAKTVSVGMGGGAVAAPEIQVGQNEISIEVTLSYEVK